MTEQMVVEYVANSAWQAPLLALGAWALVKTLRPGVLVEHWVWLSVLALAVMLPMLGTERARVVPGVQSEPALNISPLRAYVASGETGVRAMRSGINTTTHAHGVTMSVAATRWLLGLYGTTILFGVLRLARAWTAARRLVRESRQAVLPEETMHLLEACVARLHTELPRLRETCGLAGPAVVGAMRPVLLLPERFVEYASDEIRAAVLHEMAHVRRRDYAVNLVCQVAALPVAWHPATRWIQQRIRVTREMVCDRIAADEMELGSGSEYARCLVALARQMLARQMAGEYVPGNAVPNAVGLFEKGTMEERVMRLTDAVTTETMSVRTKVLRAASGAAAMLAVTVAAATFHVRPTFAAVESMGSVAVVQAAVPGATAAPAAATKPSAAVPAEQAQSAAASGVSSPPDVEQEGDASASTAIPTTMPTATAGDGEYVHRWVGADGKRYVVVNRDPKEPNAEERLKQEQKLKDSQKQLDGMEIKLDASGMKMEELQNMLGNLNSMKVEAARVTNDPQIKQDIAELKKQMSDPAWQKEIAKAGNDARFYESAEWKKQMDDLQKNAARMGAAQESQIAQVAIDSAKVNAKVNAQVNAQVDAQVDAQVKIGMAEAQKELASGELKAKLDAAQRMLDEVRQQMQEMQKK